MPEKTGITKWLGREVFTQATEANIRAMRKASLLVERDVKTHFTLQGTGRTIKGVWVPGASIRKTKSGKRHQAAAPGKPPAIDTGVLRSSIISEVTLGSFDNVIGRVGPDVQAIAATAEAGTDVNYGLFLEVGTKDIAARPFLRPALRRMSRKIKKIFKDANR